jgi:hypothetical protein
MSKRLFLIAQGTMSHGPHTPAHLCILLQPHIAAVLTPDDCIACKVRVAFLTNVDDDFSIANADL